MCNRTTLQRAATLAATTLLSILLAACGGGGGGDGGTAPPPAGTVGPAGGTVASADGNATLAIPAGALNTAIQAELTPATAADGYVDDPQIIPGTVYRLDAPETALTTPATFDIAVPAGATAAATRQRVHEQAIVAAPGFLGCYLFTYDEHGDQHATPTGIPPGVVVGPSDTLLCAYDSSFYPSESCPAGWVTHGVGFWKIPGYFKTSDSVGEVTVCEAAPTPAPLLASLLGKLTPQTGKPTTLSFLNRNVFGVLLDKTPPHVAFTANTAVIALGNGMAKIHLEATASDDVGLSHVDFTEETAVNGNPVLGQPITTLLLKLATFMHPSFVWESAPMPADQIYAGNHSFYAIAYDAAGNKATASKSFTVATPLITSFTASPSMANFGGQDVTLNWTTPGLDSPNFSDTLSLSSSTSPIVTDVTGQTSATVQVTTTTTFTLTGTNPSGPGTPATVTVQIGPQDAPTISAFTATPTAVAWNGGNVMLQWASNGADHLAITTDVGPTVGDVTGLTSIPVTITAATTFTLTASNASTTHPTATVHVSLLPKPTPTITSFTSSPPTLPSVGGPVTLMWNATLADTYAITSVPSLNIGAVTGSAYTTPPLTATTTFTLTATNASGPSAPVALTVVVASSGDRFVDVAAGSDGNACTQAAPCKTIAKGLAGAQSQSTVWLVSGVYGVTTQSTTAETIPDGVTLKAVTAGGAVVTNAPLVAAGSATVNGIVLDRDIGGNNIGSISAASSTGTPTLLLIGVRTTQEASFLIGGNVKATMSPGALAGGVYTSSLSAGQGEVVALSGNAELTIQGGIIDGNAAYTVYPLISAAGQSKLTLDGATIRNRQATVISATDQASVILKNGTLIDNVAGGIVTAGTNNVSIDHSQISHYTVAIRVSTTANVPTITLTNSTLAHSVQPPLAGYAILSDQGGADAVVSLDGVTITDNYDGIRWAGMSAATVFDIKNSTITGNSGTGMQLFGLGGSYKMRTTSVSNNGNSNGGVSIYAVLGIDFGTQASPGGNTFTGNTGNGLFVGQTNGPATVQAVGNTWTPNQQGADATGHYSTSPSYVPVPKVGPASGANYNIGAGVTANL